MVLYGSLSVSWWCFVVDNNLDALAYKKHVTVVQNLFSVEGDREKWERRQVVDKERRKEKK